MSLDETFRQIIREEIVKALAEQVSPSVQAEFKPTVVPQAVPPGPPPVPQAVPPGPPPVPQAAPPGAPPVPQAVPPGPPPVPQAAPPGPPPAPQAAPSGSVTLDDIQALANDFHRAQPHRAAEIIAVLATVNAQKMTDIPKSQYTKVYSDIKAIAGVQ